MEENKKVSNKKTTKKVTKDVRKKQLEKAYNEKQIIQGKVVSIDENLNLIVDLGNNIKAIMPRDEITLLKDENGEVAESYIYNRQGKIIKFKIIDKSEEGEYQYIISKKSVEIDSRKWMQNNLKEGMVVYGRVRGLQTYGVFVEILEGVTGLLHIEDISVARTRHPSERFSMGEKIKVVIKDFDRDTGKIVLSHKELLGTWEENAELFEKGTEVWGIAREREKNGIFVELKPNLVGLAEHKSGVEYGQKVLVYIKKIVPEKQRIKLVIVG